MTISITEVSAGIRVMAAGTKGDWCLRSSQLTLNLNDRPPYSCNSLTICSVNPPASAAGDGHYEIPGPMTRDVLFCIFQQVSDRGSTLN